jgi:hypothetical protein
MVRRDETLESCMTSKANQVAHHGGYRIHDRAMKAVPSIGRASIRENGAVR